MFLNSWSLALCLSSVVVLILVSIACRTAVRVLRFWDPSKDNSRQIRLESEIWLSSTLVSYALGFQIISLVLFVMAADQYSSAITGAMCATGSLLANDFGLPALLVKFVGVFLYGYWIVLHKLDISSELYPLVRLKYLYLLVLLPLLVLDGFLQTMFIAGLKPDIITSCCAVVFGQTSGGGPNLLSSFSHGAVLAVFYSSVVLLALMGGGLQFGWQRLLAIVYSLGWLFFLAIALVAVTTLFSSYIYAMPYHKCPFCIIKPEYHYIGLAIYATLIPGGFWGSSVLLAEAVKKREGLAGPVAFYQKFSVRISLAHLFVFTVLVSYHFLAYTFGAGEM